MAFALGDVFEIYSPKKRFNANTVQFGGKYPYVARGSSNNGIRGYITEDVQYLSPAKSLSFGQDTATVFYQPDAYFTGDKIKVMVLRNHELNDKLAQYFITVITKAFSTFAWGQSSFNEKILKATKIVLPVAESPDPDHEYTIDDIDFEYMQERIAELEQERIAELDAYLAASGLDDYELTDEDKEILSLSPESAPDKVGTSEVDFGNGQKFKKLRIGDIFSWMNGNVDLKKEHVNGRGYPLISSGLANMGIIGRTDAEARIIPADTITVDMFGNAFYRDFEYKEVTHARVFTLVPNGFHLNRKTGLYIVSSLSFLSKEFSYNNMCSYAKIESEKVILPVIESSDPNHEYTADDIDFGYMERYIRAIEKLAIADVVKYKDKLIETTKQIAEA